MIKLMSTGGYIYSYSLNTLFEIWNASSQATMEGWAKQLGKTQSHALPTWLLWLIIPPYPQLWY